MQCELHQFIRGEKGARHYTDGDVLAAETLFPGLALRINDLFALPEVED
jgi:hypothetical protein